MYSLINEFVTLDEDEKRRKELEIAIEELEDYAFHHSMKREISGKAIAVALSAMVKERERGRAVDMNYCPHCGRKLRRVE